MEVCLSNTKRRSMVFNWQSSQCCSLHLSWCCPLVCAGPSTAVLRFGETPRCMWRHSGTYLSSYEMGRFAPCPAGRFGTAVSLEGLSGPTALRRSPPNIRRQGTAANHIQVIERDDSKGKGLTTGDLRLITMLRGSFFGLLRRSEGRWLRQTSAPLPGQSMRPYPSVSNEGLWA